LTGDDLLSMVNFKKGELDVLFGGPPCQGFTFVNARRSIDDPRSKLMWEFIRMIREIQPKYFVIENVPGLLGFKDFFRELLVQLEESKYNVRFNMMDAANYWVPQTRRRIFIEGGRKDLNIIPAFPRPVCFNPKMIHEEQLVCQADMALECFRANGFTKEEIGDVWWNTKLGILMNKKTASDEFDLAVNRLVAKKVLAMARNKKYVKVG
jgi:DNA-cytosine methyltransferase